MRFVDAEPSGRAGVALSSLTLPLTLALLGGCAAAPPAAAAAVADPGSHTCYAYSDNNFEQVLPLIERGCEKGDAVSTNALLADEVCDFSKSVMYHPMQRGVRDDRVICIYRGAVRPVRKPDKQ